VSALVIALLGFLICQAASSEDVRSQIQCDALDAPKCWLNRCSEWHSGHQFVNKSSLVVNAKIGGKCIFSATDNMDHDGVFFCAYLQSSFYICFGGIDAESKTRNLLALGKNLVREESVSHPESIFSQLITFSGLYLHGPRVRVGIGNNQPCMGGDMEGRCAPHISHNDLNRCADAVVIKNQRLIAQGNLDLDPCAMACGEHSGHRCRLGLRGLGASACGGDCLLTFTDSTAGSQPHQASEKPQPVVAMNSQKVQNASHHSAPESPSLLCLVWVPTAFWCWGS
jgi:hypothetical protein